MLSFLGASDMYAGMDTVWKLYMREKQTDCLLVPTSSKSYNVYFGKKTNEKKRKDKKSKNSYNAELYTNYASLAYVHQSGVPQLYQ